MVALSQAYKDFGFEVILPDATGYIIVRDRVLFTSLTTSMIAEVFGEHAFAIAPGPRDFGLPNRTFRISVVRPLKKLNQTRERLEECRPALEELSFYAQTAGDFN